MPDSFEKWGLAEKRPAETTRYMCCTRDCPRKTADPSEPFCRECKAKRPPVVYCNLCSTPGERAFHEEGRHVRGS